MLPMDPMGLHKTGPSAVAHPYLNQPEVIVSVKSNKKPQLSPAAFVFLRQSLRHIA
jgi:hypothetical protein